jgi:prepilin-type N-terminal cleavage/methylation domain-containing protein
MNARRIIRRRRRGLGLIEMMVALSISAALLTATGVALDTAIKAYRINLQQAMLLQNARTAMNRILTTIRRTKLHAPDTALQRAQFAGNTTVTGTGIAMFDANNTEIDFRYDATAKTVNAVSNGVARPLIHGVEDFSVTLKPMRSATSAKINGPWDLLERATILMTVRTADQNTLDTESDGRVVITLSASVMPRRNTW